MFGSITQGNGGSITFISRGDSAPNIGSIKTTGRGTRITIDTDANVQTMNRAIIGTIENTGEDCVLVQIHGGQDTVTTLTPGTVTTCYADSIVTTPLLDTADSPPES